MDRLLAAISFTQVALLCVGVMVWAAVFRNWRRERDAYRADRDRVVQQRDEAYFRLTPHMQEQTVKVWTNLEEPGWRNRRCE